MRKSYILILNSTLLLFLLFYMSGCGGDSLTTGNVPTATPTNSPGNQTVNGKVYNLFTGVPVANASIVNGSNMVTTDPDVNYKDLSIDEKNTRIKITASSYVDREMSFSSDNKSQDISLIPGNYNMEMYRALNKLSVFPNTVRFIRQPKIIIYTKFLVSGQSVDPNMLKLTEDTLKNDLTGSSGSIMSNLEITYLNMSPREDPNMSYDPNNSSAYTLLPDTISVSYVETFLYKDIYGCAICMCDFKTGLINSGGICIPIDGNNNIVHTISHQTGHVFGLQHPFEYFVNSISDPLCEVSVMNDYRLGKSTDIFSEADKKALIINNHRAPEHQTPDIDPEDWPGYYKNASCWQVYKYYDR
ncbi:MAG: hypothetical protein ABRQ37_10665 [Candidatus Eremiobacterota bacterium]